jgi:histidinol-phosphate/aromatic aminotransferase/cobyric acid decarboxylase-like protein
MRDAIVSARIDLYPDSTAVAARVALGASCGVAAERVVVGNGGADLLWTLARLLVAPGRAVVMVEPTFSEFRAAAVAAGARVVPWHASPQAGFAVDRAALAAIAETARTCDAAAIYLCTPNNPTGAGIRAGHLVALAEQLPRAIVVVDQAFLSLSEHHADAAADLPDNVVRVRSLTKEHAIPGVRVGYLIGTPAIAAAVEAARPAWSTGAAAQAAAIASVELAPFVAESRERMLADRRALAEGLRGLDLAPAPTCTTYLIVPIGDAHGLRRALLSRHRILVRDCASFGLPSHVRLAARPAADRQRLLAALQQELPRR